LTGIQQTKPFIILPSSADFKSCKIVVLLELLINC